MKILIMVKQIGKRKPIISGMEVELPSEPSTLKELITQIVTLNVERYNQGDPERHLLTALTDEEIADQADTGKVGFGARYNSNSQDVGEAIGNACLAFADGLYKAFINEVEIERLEERITLQENDRILFVRLTMLAGRMW